MSEMAAERQIRERAQDPEAMDALLGGMGISPEDVDDAPPTEAPQDTPATQEGEAEQVTVPEEPEFEIDPQLPDDILADIDVEEEPPVEEEEEDFPGEAGEYDEDEEYADERLLAERKKRVAAEKKAAWLETQKLKADRKRWIEKEADYFPLADVESIAGRSSSRREFRRLAAAEQKRMVPRFKRALKAAQAEAKAEVEQRREEVAQAWGKPVSGPPMPAQAAHQMSRIDQARQTGSLIETIKARMLVEE